MEQTGTEHKSKHFLGISAYILRSFGFARGVIKNGLTAHSYLMLSLRHQSLIPLKKSHGSLIFHIELLPGFDTGWPFQFKDVTITHATLHVYLTNGPRINICTS